MASVKVADAPVEQAGCCVPGLAPAISSETAGDMAKMFKALGDPIRLQLLSMIASSVDECCVCDLTEPFDLTAPTISYHLKVLREAGLVDSDRRGTWVYYSARRENLALLSGALGRQGLAPADVD